MLQRWKKVAMAGVALMLGAGTGEAAVTIAYDNSIVAANQSYGHALGLDFNVLAPIEISALGVFNSGDLAHLDGVAGGGVAVGIYNRVTHALVGPLVTMNSSSTVNQINGNAFVSVTPFVLSAGFQGSVVAFNVFNYNTFGQANTTSTLNDNGGLIAFVGGARYGGALFDYPTLPDAGPDNRYNAGSFIYDSAPIPISGAVPEPSTIAAAACGLPVALVALRRRRRLA